MEKEKLKLEIMEAIEQEDYDKVLKTLKEVIEQGKITTLNSFYLNELIKVLVNLKLSDAENWKKEHDKKMAYLFASRI